MQRDIIDMPFDIVRELSFNWDIDWRGQPGTDNTQGTSQVVVNQFPRWVGRPSYFVKPSEVGRWRALRAKVQGRKNVWRIKLTDPAVFDASAQGLNTSLQDTGIPWLGTGGTGELLKEGGDNILKESGDKLVTGHEDLTWSNDQNWDYDFFMRMNASASAGDTSITVDISIEGVAPVLGQIISYGDYPYLVTSVTQDSTNIYTLEIQMPLRTSIPSGDSIKYIGTGLFEALTDTEGNPSYTDVGFSRPQFQFREYLR